MKKIILGVFTLLFVLNLQAQVDLTKDLHLTRKLENKALNQNVEDWINKVDLYENRKDVKKSIVTTLGDKKNMLREIEISLDPQRNATKYGARQAEIQELVATSDDYVQLSFTEEQARSYALHVQEMIAIKDWLKNDIKYDMSVYSPDHVTKIKRFRDAANACFKMEDAAYQRALTQ